MATNSSINTLIDMNPFLQLSTWTTLARTHTQMYAMSYQQSCRYSCTVRFVSAEKGGERKKQTVKTVCDRVCGGKVWGDSSLVRNNKKHIHERCRGVVQQHKRGTEWSAGAESADHIHLICLLFLLSLAQNLFHNILLLCTFSTYVTQRSYLSRSKDIVLKNYFDEKSSIQIELTLNVHKLTIDNFFALPYHLEVNSD